jgi:phosphoribosylaminoimidazolecarboxamide formyltransferase/IMP cyclohydrolase
MDHKVDREIVMRYPRYALLSVSDKTGIENLARALCDFGFELLATSGTGEALIAAGIPVTRMDELTGYPEMLEGRVKCLHPRVFSAIMAKDTKKHFNELLEIKTSFVDIVICNIYPFQRVADLPGALLNEVVSRIDIGGPALLKAAAKNFERVAVVCDTDKYEDLLWYLASKGEVPYEIRFEWAKRAFEHVTAYDSMVYATLLEYDLATGQRISKSCRY